jgi:hypothetical protein
LKQKFLVISDPQSQPFLLACPSLRFFFNARREEGMSRPLFSFLLVAGVTGAPSCRCVPPAPCWDSIPWDTLNASVGGRLVRTQNELAACLANVSSVACQQELGNSDNEFWLSGQPGGYLHTGLFGTWNISGVFPVYSVVALVEEDFQAATAFASQYNIRLVVKATGHDWYGRSAAAGSLMLWTHARSNITFNESWLPQVDNIVRGDERVL